MVAKMLLKSIEGTPQNEIVTILGQDVRKRCQKVMNVMCWKAKFGPAGGRRAGGRLPSTEEQTAVVQGTVTIEGELEPSGTVTLIPVKEGPVAVGTIHSGTGVLTLRVGQGNLGNPDRARSRRAIMWPRW